MHWYFYVPLRPEPSILSFYVFIFLWFYFFIVLIKICGENPAKYPRLSKNPPKYTTAYIVQQSNCRWHGEPTCFEVRLKQRKDSSHPPSSISPSTISPSPIPPSPNPPSRFIDQLDYFNIKNISVRLPDEVMPTILAQLQQRHKATVLLSSCQLRQWPIPNPGTAGTA